MTDINNNNTFLTLSKNTLSDQGNFFEVETSKTIDGIEMGVLSDGTPFLTQRGLQAFCGLTTNGIISNLSKEWEELHNSNGVFSGKSRLAFLKRVLDEAGYHEKKLYINTKFKGIEVYAYPGVVCMAILEYYAFETEQPIEIAIKRYRNLSKYSFRLFVYNLVGYTPKTDREEKWKYFLDRIDLNYDNPPPGYFSIFQEMTKLTHALIKNELTVNDKTIPDISAGMCWGKEWKEKGLEKEYGERIQYQHNYPDYYPQAMSNPQHPWAYPEKVLPYFREWFRSNYLQKKFPQYLRTKMPALASDEKMSNAIKSLCSPENKTYN